jgi:hypothetical protein
MCGSFVVACTLSDCSQEWNVDVHRLLLTTVRSLIKLITAVTSWLLPGNATKKLNCFYCFYGAILYLYRENLLALGGESAVPAGSREVTVVFNYNSEHTVY